MVVYSYNEGIDRFIKANEPYFESIIRDKG